MTAADAQRALDPPGAQAGRATAGTLLGVGYRPELAAWIEAGAPELGCLEITAEHFYGGSSRERLRGLAKRFPLMVHSLGLSLGTPGPLDSQGLASLAEVAREAQALWVSDHLGFCRTDEIELGHFNPICPDRASLDLVAEHVREVAETCGTPVLLENITSELRIRGSLSETEFLNRLCEESGCGLLLDVTNLYVNSRNHHFDPSSWLRDIDPQRIVQLHVVGYTQRGGHYYDVHAEGIQEDLWALIRESLDYAPVRAVVIERDDNFPPVQELEKELCALGGGRGVAALMDLVRRPGWTGTGPVSGMRVADDVSFSLLEEGGVLLSERRQELHAFNTEATYIWCCLEEGLGADEIASAYAAAFDVSGAEAWRCVAGMLHRWQGLGYLFGVAVPAPVAIDFTTALGRLLGNPRLRRQFAVSPQETARRQGLRREDWEAFCSLEPGELERQAALLEAKRAKRKSRSRRNLSTSSFLSSRQHDPQSSPERVRHYRVLDGHVCIRFGCVAAEQQVHAALAHLEKDEPAEVQKVVTLVEQGREWLVSEDSAPVALCSTIDRVAPIVSSLLRQVAIDQRRPFLELRASAVASDGRCLLLPGPARTGKTTLAATLIASGFSCVSDDVTLVEHASLRARVLPFGLDVAHDVVELLQPHYPDLPNAPMCVREDGARVRCLVPPSAARCPTPGADVRWIVFPHYAPDGGQDLRPIPKAAALQRLMRECLVDSARLNRRNARGLVEWISGVDCFELSFGSASEAVRAIAKLRF